MIARKMVAASLLFVSGPVIASPGIGEVVSNTSFTTAYGQNLSIGDLRGEVVVLTFWMRECEACDDQLKMLDYYYRQRRTLGLRVLAVPVEDLSDRQLRAEFKGKLIHPLARIGGPFEPLGSLPTTYVIDRHGQVRYATPRLMSIDQLNQVLVPLLRQPQP